MEFGTALLIKKLLILFKHTAEKLNPDGSRTIKVSDICSAIFDNNLAIDTFGRGGTGKEGAG